MVSKDANRPVVVAALCGGSATSGWLGDAALGALAGGATGLVVALWTGGQDEDANDARGR